MWPDPPKAVRWGGDALLILFLATLMLDPTGTIAHMKDRVFILLFAYNLLLIRPSLRFAPHILLAFAALTLSLISATMQGNNLDLDEAMAQYKAFAPLLLLLWIRNYDYVRMSLAPAIATCLVVITIYCLCAYDERLEGAIYLYMKAHDDTAMMSHRYLMGHKVFAIYYKSFVALTFALYYYYHKLYDDPRRWYRHILPAAVLTAAFFISGTRATMLLPPFIAALVGYRAIGRLGRWRYALYPLLALFALAFLLLVAALAAEKGETSNSIKYAHLVSYKDLFSRHPLYMAIGQGIGTRFYSLGFHRFTFTTEWTYLELARQFGLFSLLLLATLLWPLRLMHRYRRRDYCFGLMGTYVAYLLVAGTNPLLMSSTGMAVVLTAYSAACVEERKKT